MQIDPNSVRITLNGVEIKGWGWQYKADKVFEYTKAPYELVVKENLKQAVMNMGVILDCKDIQLIPSAKYKGCFRMRPALTEEQMNMAKNYLDTYMEV